MRHIHAARAGQRGFTLVEVLISLAVLGIITLGLLTIFRSLDNTWISEELKADMQQNARVAMDNMVREMMMMGYGGVDKIRVARQDQIEFVEMMNDPFDPTHTDKEFWIRYSLDGDKLMKTYQPIDPDLCIGVYANPKAVVVADNVSFLSFQYFYTSPGGGLTEAADYSLYAKDYIECGSDTTVWDTFCNDAQDNRDEIRRIKVTLKVKTDRKLPGSTPTTGRFREITLKADISPRNLWEGSPAFDTIGPIFDPSSVLKVRDTGTCGSLKATWGQISDRQLAGYLVKYGTVADVYTNYIDVPVTNENRANDPEITLPDCQVHMYTDPALSAAYYVDVYAYDASGNYSITPLRLDSPFVFDPDDSISSFDGDENDTTVSIPKPAAPEGLTAAFTEHSPVPEVILTWTPHTDPNVVGYRIYRSNQEFTTFPIEEQPFVNSSSLYIKMIAKENDEGDGLVIDRTTSSSISYTDDDSALVGCSSYYYAICAVTCDTTLIYGDHPSLAEGYRGGRYDANQYATVVNVQPEEETPIVPPVDFISAQPGYRRIYLQMVWPVGTDYAYTKIYYKRGSAGVEDPPAIEDANLIIDHQIGYDRGTFYNHGTAAQNTIIFNNETIDTGDDDEPVLPDNTDYTFVAVAYDKCGNASDVATATTTFADLCGDEPCGPPDWPISSSPAIWVDQLTTNKDASTWTDSSQIRIALMWTDMDKLDWGQNPGLDFAGFNVDQAYAAIPVTGRSLTASELLNFGLWENNTKSTNLVEGVKYYYCVQAVDCIWRNITPESPDVVCKDNSIHTYDDIKRDNISNCLLLPENPATEPGVAPGRFRIYVDYSLDSTHPNFYRQYVTTVGEYHNKVLLYLQNTSAGPLTIDQMAFSWSPEVKLESITFLNVSGIDTADPEYTYTANADSLQYTDIGRDINDVATGAGMYSDPIPVLLTFVNLDGVADFSADMRRQQLSMEIRFTNKSMPSNETHTSYVSGFTTGDINRNVTYKTVTDIDGVEHTVSVFSEPITFAVTGGPSVNYIYQNEPENPYTPFTIFGRYTGVGLPVDVPEVRGQREVSLVANVTRPSTEQMQGVYIRYAVTGDSDTDPFDNATGLGLFSNITALRSGSDYFGTIPGQDGAGVWYYVEALSKQGNFSRKPVEFDAFFYYRQLGFNICNENPSRPFGLYAEPGFVSWSAVTTYDGGLAILDTDTISYKVYKKYSLSPSVEYGLYTTVTGLSVDDPEFDGLTAAMYKVIAVNTCDDPGPRESLESDPYVVCPTVGSGYNVTVSPSTIYLGESFRVEMTNCSLANNGISNRLDAAIAVFDNISGTTRVGSENVPGFEMGDTGLSYPTDLVRTTSDYAAATASLSDLLVYATDAPNKVMEEDIEVMLEIRRVVVASALVRVVVPPCSNTPKAPVLVSGQWISLPAENKGDLRLTWRKVTENTDGSSAVYSVDGVNYFMMCQTVYPADKWGVIPAPATTNMGLAVIGGNTTDNGDGTLTAYLAKANALGNQTPGPSDNNTYNFYIVAKDHCSPVPNSSAPSNIGAMTGTGQSFF